MTHAFGLVLILAALVVGAYLFESSRGTKGPSATAVTQVESQVDSAAAGTNLQGAGQVLQAWYPANGTYAGATLPPGSGVVLVRADTSSYCLQTSAGAVEHVVGPGGRPLLIPSYAQRDRRQSANRPVA
jgi:hypothetical protein